MKFNQHSELAGRHSFLSPSKYHWIRWSDDKFDVYYRNALAAQRGTELHEFASNAIRLGVKLQGQTSTLALYVNDAIRFNMTPEVVLFYSAHAFGSADAMSFIKGVLRIHDLKTGVTRASFDQLLCYAALFCLEYKISPMEIGIELRIYQEDEVKLVNTELQPEIKDNVAHIMDRIVNLSKRIDKIREVELA